MTFGPQDAYRPPQPVSDTNPDSLAADLQAPEITEELNNDLPATSKTPKFTPDIYEPTAATMTYNEDSFINSIKSRSPGKLSAEPSEHEDDSFVDKIISRTPRPASRIEDSVEAMDMLEDALEQFSGELPVLDDLRIDSPTKEHAASPAKTPASVRRAAVGSSSLQTVSGPVRRSSSKSPSKASTKSVDKPTSVAAPQKTAALRTSHVRPSTAKTAAKTSVVKKPIAGLAAPTTQSTIKDSRPGMSVTNPSINAQPNAVKKRVPSDTLSTSRPGFVPTKSTKPATKSTFTLPGEAYTAKMRAQREEKLKKEEESRAKRQFKARPAPSMSNRPSVLPRENKASQARLSRVFSGNDKENVEPKTTTSRRPVSMAIDVKKVRTEPNSSIRRATSVTSKSSNSTSREPKFAANLPRVASLTSKPVAPKEESPAPITHKKVSGREVFGRSKLELKKQEEDKREKEEAARKARAEAAERGRQASREWAEKQKAKLAAQKATKAPETAAIA